MSTSIMILHLSLDDQRKKNCWNNFTDATCLVMIAIFLKYSDGKPAL